MPSLAAEFTPTQDSTHVADEDYGTAANDAGEPLLVGALLSSLHGTQLLGALAALELLELHPVGAGGYSSLEVTVAGGCWAAGAGERRPLTRQERAADAVSLATCCPPSPHDIRCLPCCAILPRRRRAGAVPAGQRGGGRADARAAAYLALVGAGAGGGAAAGDAVAAAGRKRLCPPPLFPSKTFPTTTFAGSSSPLARSTAAHSPPACAPTCCCTPTAPVPHTPNSRAACSGCSCRCAWEVGGG